MTPRKTLPFFALAGLAFATAACSSSVNTEPDEVAIVYSAARGSATRFEKCVPVSAREGVSASDNTWTYPAGQRNFRFTGEEGAESDKISVVSKDNITLSVPGFVTFALNTDCKTLQMFHERIGLKYGAYLYGTETEATSDSPNAAGWVHMLNTYLKGPLDRAMDAASQEFGWKELFNDPATKAAWEKRVGELVGDFITKSGGGQFFCQPNFGGAGECGAVSLTLQKPEPPQALVDAMASEQAAKVQNDAQKQINMRVDTELESIEKLVKLLGPDAYVKYRAVIGDKPITVVLADGTVTVPAK